MTTAPLFVPLQLGALSLPNRIVMPALTRMRAGPGGVPLAISAEYYAQRATAGLTISEATAISVNGHGYPQMPGIYSPEQIAGWRAVTEAVHARGGRIMLQIVHHGRWSHSSYNPDGSLPDVIESGLADAVAFGRMFIANPDLPERIRASVALNRFDQATAYAGDAHGFTDYPALTA
jgi:N-ethylmaleimide reductase